MDTFVCDFLDRERQKEPIFTFLVNVAASHFPCCHIIVSLDPQTLTAVEWRPLTTTAPPRTLTPSPPPSRPSPCTCSVMREAILARQAALLSCAHGFLALFRPHSSSVSEFPSSPCPVHPMVPLTVCAYGGCSACTDICCTRPEFYAT